MKCWVVRAAILNLVANVIMVFLILLPRKYTRRVRHTLARLVMGLWVGTMRLWTMLYEDFWQKGNGH